MRPRRVTTKIIIVFLVGTFGIAWLTSGKPDDDQVKSRSGGKKQDGSQRNEVVFQDRTNNCGAAALKMVLEHFGHTGSLRELERQLVLSIGGTSMQQLKEIASAFGLQAYGCMLRREDLASVRYPIIMFLKKNHFVVADRLDTSGCLLVRDPAMGVVKISPQALLDIWNGEALVFASDQTASIRTKNMTQKE